MKLGTIVYLVEGNVVVRKVVGDMLDECYIELERFDLDDPDAFDKCLTTFGMYHVESIELYDGIIGINIM